MHAKSGFELAASYSHLKYHGLHTKFQILPNICATFCSSSILLPCLEQECQSTHRAELTEVVGISYFIQIRNRGRVDRVGCKCVAPSWIPRSEQRIRDRGRVVHVSCNCNSSLLASPTNQRLWESESRGLHLHPTTHGLLTASLRVNRNHQINPLESSLDRICLSDNHVYWCC